MQRRWCESVACAFVRAAQAATLSLGVLGCGGSEFSTGPGGGAGSAGANGGNDAVAGEHSGGGTRGGADVGGSAGADAGGVSASGGSGGDVTTGCACPSGQYCREATNDCFDCAQFSRLRFSEPERLATVSDVGGGTLRFPRVGNSGTDLFYRSAALDSETVWYTTDVATSAGGALDPIFPPDSGPLLLARSIADTSGQSFNFALDRDENGVRKLAFGQWASGLLGATIIAPAPYNADGANDQSAAIALDALPNGGARMYWMSDRDGNVGMQLVTSVLSNAPVAVPVPLTVERAACPADRADLTPWVTPDGTLLLFTNTALSADCVATGTDTNLYVALMVPSSGLQEANNAAVALSDVNGSANETDPSFSRDFCDVYFASDRDGSWNLYRAHRR